MKSFNFQKNTQNKSRILIAGYGITGQSVHRYLEKKAQKAELIVYDQKKIENLSLPQISNNEICEKINLAVISPGFNKNNSKNNLITALKEKNIKIISDLDLWNDSYLAKKIIRIGVTGTNGKSTMVALIEHIFQALGIKAVACGNNGLNFLDTPEDTQISIEELSSAALNNHSTDLNLQISCIMNIYKDHEVFHTNAQEYLQSKLKITHNKSCIFINDQSALKHFVNKDRFAKDDELFQFTSNDEISFKGKKYKIAIHQKFDNEFNRKNIEQALSITEFILRKNFPPQIENETQKLIDSIQTFKGLEFRNELIGTVEGVSFINDSKSSNCKNLEKAIERQSEKFNLILGGKGMIVDDMIGLLNKHHGMINKIFIIGDLAKEKTEAFNSIINKYEISFNLQLATDNAFKNAKKNQINTVVFSPGCKSYDQFKNYIERGENFNQYFQNITHNKAF